jgi:hypothetical protein
LGCVWTSLNKKLTVFTLTNSFCKLNDVKRSQFYKAVNPILLTAVSELKSLEC